MLISVLSGIPVYLTVFTASAGLGISKFADFIGLWAMLNALGLIFFSPIENSAAQNKTKTSGASSGFYEKRWILLGTAISVPAGAVLSSSLYELPPLSAFFVPVWFLVSLGAWSGLKAKNFASEQPRKTLHSTFFATLISCGILVACYFAKVESPEIYLLALPVAWTLLAGKSYATDLWEAIHTGLRASSLRLHSFFSLTAQAATYAILAALGFILVSSGGQDLEKLPTFVAVSTLMRAGFQIVSTLTPTVALHYVQSEPSRGSTLRTAALHSSVSLIAGFAAILIFGSYGDWLIAFYIHQSSNISIEIIGLIILGETLWSAMSGPSTGLIFRRGESTFYLSSVSAIFFYVVVVAIFGSTVFGVALASAGSGAIVLGIQYVSLFNSSHSAD